MAYALLQIILYLAKMYKFYSNVCVNTYSLLTKIFPFEIFPTFKHIFIRLLTLVHCSPLQVAKTLEILQNLKAYEIGSANTSSE